MLPILFSQCLAKEALEGFGDFKIGGKIIHTLKYADDLVLLAKVDKVLQDMIDELIEIGGCYGMEMNVKKNKSDENFKTTIPSKNYDRTKTTRECDVGLLWLKLHSTRRGLFLLAHWTWN